MRHVVYLAAAALFGLLADTASAGDCYRTSAVVVQQQVATYAVQQAPVYAQVQAAPVCTYATCAPVQAAVAYAPVVQQSYAVQSAVYQPQFVQRQFVSSGYGYGGGAAFVGGRQFVGGGQFRGPPIVRGGFGGGFGGGPLAQGFQTGGLLGAAERFTGLGNGSGDFGRGAIIGVLGARSNLFGLGRR